MRKLEIYVEKYGPEVGSRLYRVLQSQAGHASVGARLRRKIEAIRERGVRPLPLFEEVPARPAMPQVGGLEVNPDADLLEPRPSR